MANGVKVDTKALRARTKALPAVIEAGVHAVLEYHAPQVSSYAKTHAPWEDQTSNARNGLDAKTYRDGLTQGIVLFHQVPYGIWLEVRWDGQVRHDHPDDHQPGAGSHAQHRRTLGETVNVRERVYGSLAAYAPLTDLVPAERIYETSSTPDSPQPIYLVLRYLEVSITATPMHQQYLEVWAHDKPGTYTDIEQVLKTARPGVLAALGPTDDGWLSDISWRGDSLDLYDGATQTIVRYSTYLLTGSGV
jgi:hypothetical protein